MTRRGLAPALFFLACLALLGASVLHPVFAPHGRSSQVLLFVAMFAALGGLICAGLRPPTAAEPRSRWDLGLLVLLFAFHGSLVLQLVLGIDIGNRTPLLQRTASAAFVFAGLLIFPYYLHLRERAEGVSPGWLGRWTARWMGPGALGFLVGAAVLVKLVGILGEPRPSIDIFDFLQDGAKMVLRGQNPYVVPNHEAVARGLAFGYPTATYPYTPAVWLVTSPFVRWLGDARYAYVFTDLLAALLLFAVGRGAGVSARVRRYTELGALLVLFHPASFAKAWTDELLVPIAIAPLYLALRTRPGGRGSGLALCIGFGLSLKQYLLTLAPLFAVWLRTPRRLLLATAAGLSVAIPFLLWDAGALWRSVFGYHLNTPFRDDTLSIAAFTHHVFGWQPPTWVGFAFLLVFLGGGLYAVLRRGFVALAAWSSLALLWLFAGSSHAFANYYHCVLAYLLVAGLALAIENEAPRAFENAAFRVARPPLPGPEGPQS